MEGIKIVNEVEFEEVKKPGFLERFKSLKLLFRGGGEKMVTVQPETGVEIPEPVPVMQEIEKTQEVKSGGFMSFFKKNKKEIPELPSEHVEPVTKIHGIKFLSESEKAEQKTEPMVRILPREENQYVAGEKPLVEFVKPVKLERSILGFDEEKEIVKLENRLRKTRLLFEKKLKEKVEELEKRKLEIEQTMMLESQAKREAELNRKEEILNKKEREIDIITKKRQLEREMEVIKKEKEMRQKLNEETKKFLEKEKELTIREKELDSALINRQLEMEEDLKRKQMELLEKEKMLGVGIDEEVKKLLKVLDELLGKLPKEVIDEFVKSEEYKLYEKVLERYGV